MESIGVILASCLLAQAGGFSASPFDKDQAAAPAAKSAGASGAVAKPSPFGAHVLPGAGLPAVTPFSPGTAQPSGMQSISRPEAGAKAAAPAGGGAAPAGGAQGPASNAPLGPPGGFFGPALPNMNLAPGSASPSAVNPPGGLQAPAASGAAPAQASGAKRETPAHIVADCLSLPPGSTIQGRAITLRDSLSTTADRRRQQETVQAYWRLAAALAEYRIAFDEKDLFDRVEGKPANAALVRTARASAAAALRGAELALVSAQYDLAETAALSATTPLALPADLPHVGPYRTYFDELFGARAAPGRTRLIHRTVPIHQQAIEAQAASVLAAQDAMLAAFDGYQTGEVDWSAWVTSVRQWSRQRRLLIRAACDYNHDITEYAFAVASPQTSLQALVNMLIRSTTTPAGKPAAPKGGSSDRTPSSEVQPAGFVDPAAQPAGGPSSPAGVPVGPPAPGASPKAVAPSEPPRTFAAPPNAAPLPANNPPAGSSLRSIVIPLGSEAPASAPGPAASPIPTQPVSPVLPGPQGTTTRRTAHRLAENARRALLPGPLYAALADSAPAVRAKQLAVALHTSHAPTEQKAVAVDLKQCLQGAPAPDRRAAIDAYWLASQRSAERQFLADQGGLLEQLRPTALNRRADRGGSAAMLRLQSAVTANGADQLRAQVRLLESQFELTRLAGRPQDSAWLLPTTVPHSGPYTVPQDGSRSASAESWRARRPSATLPAWLADLQDRAAATVAADAARAAATAGYESGTGTLDLALAANQQQLDETLGFLDTLTGYNRAIADYALSVLPATTSADQLVKALVVVR